VPELFAIEFFELCPHRRKPPLSRFRGSRYLAEVKDRETLISSPVRGTAAMQGANFVADSLLEGDGFELSVPRQSGYGFET
jgi:hypothetical protein